MISLIIPAHNEAALIADTVGAAKAALDAWGEVYEIVVVDDDSSDDTAAIASGCGARVVHAQLRHIAAVRNAGAAAAKGDRFVFLDADTLLPVDTLRAAMRALRGGAVGGGCGVAFGAGTPLAGVAMAAVWNMLSRVWRWAAGSFVFVHRADFEAVGGFDERYYAAEEIVLSMALKRRGPFTILPHQVHTSERKMHSHTATEHLWLMVKTIATCGAAIRRRDGLHIWYGDQRSGETGESSPSAS